MKKSILLLIGVFTLTFSAKAQDGFENIFLADVADSKKILQAYFAPGMEGFITSMNSGWAHTAKVYKTLGFGISIGASGAFIKSEKELFNINALGLTSVTSTSPTASTIGGPSTSTTMTINTTIDTPIGPQAGSTNIQFPGGVDLLYNAVPAPIAQLNVGTPWKMDVMLRFIPKIKIGENDNSVNMLGLGLKKEITSWFGPIENIPLHVSLLAAYTTMDVNYRINDQNSGELLVQNALTTFNLKAFTVQAIASLNFPVINLYGGIGYNTGSSTFNIDGTFTGVYATGFPPPNATVTKPLAVPSNLDFESRGFRTTLGARLSLGFFNFFTDVTLQEYPTLSGGFAFDIQ
ncbi:MAG: DUF6588 family protein [Polaribacter sp.]